MSPNTALPLVHAELFLLNVADPVRYVSLLNNGNGREKMKVYPWILGKRNFTLEPMVSAPTPLRNKCELTFGYRYLLDETDATSSGQSGESVSKEPTELADGDVAPEPRKVPACGFLVTGWAGGVAFSNELQNIPSEVGVVVEITNQFLLTSALAPYDPLTHTGFWRLLTVRLSRRTRECMLIIQHVPASGGGIGEADDNDAAGSPDFTEAFAVERERLLSMLTQASLAQAGEEEPFGVTSIFFQEFDGLSSASPEHPVQV